MNSNNQQVRQKYNNQNNQNILINKRIYQANDLTIDSFTIIKSSIKLTLFMKTIHQLQKLLLKSDFLIDH
jgi:hypothetical protein